jgi:xylulokinase
MNNYLLGLDYGTGGAKACIIDDKANVLAYAFREYPIITTHDGWSEHDPNLYWALTCEMIKEVIIKAEVDPKKIKGIGTSAALPSMVMIDNDGTPINLAYNLMDKRAIKEVAWIEEKIGSEKLFKITANRLEDHPTLVNLLWEKNNRPKDYEKIDKALTIDGFIRYKLTGKTTAHYSAGPLYGVGYNILDNTLDVEILMKIGIKESLIPEFYPCEAIIGEVTKDAAIETGLVSGIAVAGGQVDCNAGWLGAGAIEVGDMQMNLGTCGNFGIIHKETDFLNSMINLSYTKDSKDTYVTVATTTTGGQSIRYLRDQFSHLEVAMEKLIPDFDVYDFLNMEAEKINVGSDGLLILPYLMGERTPLWDVDARGVIFGLSLHHTKAHLVRAMMEAVAYALYDSFVLMKERGMKINYPLVLNEGGAKSRLWRKIITDVFHVPTVLVKNRVGAPYGDAILAGVATGVFKDYSIAKEKAEYIDLMEPSEENHAIYMDYFKLYKDLYNDVKENYKTLSQIRSKYIANKK